MRSLVIEAARAYPRIRTSGRESYLLIRQYQTHCTIGARGYLVETKWLHDHRLCKNLLQCHRLAKLGERIERCMTAVLHGHSCNLLA
ncbi:hypothetical protein RGI145_24125 (plasmid) [Roseomonas gilardii]|uniref:Uncharacterized protein n=1 Tax=Roseomonas gilardii TaxID=257708 RepID=A0A1L7ANS3_9PROT|nr:hypothetical protein RGI145_24125 [Roseomonas gilardii]